MVELAQRVGAPRIVPGRAIAHPFGDPSLPPEEEVEYRRRAVERALKALQTPVREPSVFSSWVGREST